ncbi:hypothetical protein [Clostridium perfringens]|uniref:hypothetical protein n=1 Tax=Clostridium perfringens TaxID=1502 RepID=UPI003A3A0AA0
MPNIFQHLSDLLLNRKGKFITLTNFDANNWFGLIYKGYEGLMAQPRTGKSYVDKSKEGYFDVLVSTGNRYLDRNNHKLVTHYNLFIDLLENSSIENCYRLWRGEFPSNITNNIEEQKALSALALLMFEQELNWGNEDWQRYSNFSPKTQYPYSRPRDMIMGFVKIAFHINDLNDYPHWKYKNIDGNIVPTTPTFGKSYNSLEPEYKNFFKELSEDNSAQPLMIGNYLNKFKNAVTNAPNNQYYNLKNH